MVFDKRGLYYFSFVEVLEETRLQDVLAFVLLSFCPTITLSVSETLIKTYHSYLYTQLIIVVEITESHQY